MCVLITHRVFKAIKELKNKEELTTETTDFFSFYTFLYTYLRHIFIFIICMSIEFKLLEFFPLIEQQQNI